jgi:hypothetical protein
MIWLILTWLFLMAAILVFLHGCDTWTEEEKNEERNRLGN